MVFKVKTLKSWKGIWEILILFFLSLSFPSLGMILAEKMKPCLWGMLLWSLIWATGSILPNAPMAPGSACFSFQTIHSLCNIQVPHSLTSKSSSSLPSFAVPEYKPCKVIVINPQKVPALCAKAVCTVMVSLACFIPVHHQLCHVFHPVVATLPVLIITYKTVTVNFMASILSLQGSGAAHKLSWR